MAGPDILCRGASRGTGKPRGLCHSYRQPFFPCAEHSSVYKATFPGLVPEQEAEGTQHLAPQGGHSRSCWVAVQAHSQGEVLGGCCGVQAHSLHHRLGKG